MKSFLLALLLIQAGPQGMGVVTGVVRGANGMPASGVRVYAIGVRDSLEALNTGTAPLEGLTQTDASGRYRLEVAPGRYYIASGSVTSPTFYPGTANAANARVVTVASGGLVEAIDFSSFVAASRTPGAVAIPRGTAVLSGVLRFSDGTPAAGIPVVVMSAASVTGSGTLSQLLQVQQLLQATQPIPPSPVAGAPQPPVLGTPPPPPPPSTYIFFVSGLARFYTTSDTAGGYTVPNLPADTFYIAAGYSEFPALYPGVADLAAAKTIATTPATNLNNLDFTVPSIPSATATVRGRVTASGDAPTGGVRVEIRSASTTSMPSAYGLPSINPNRFVDTGGDGRFEFPNVRAGSYIVRASYSALYSETKNIGVSDQPVEGVDFVLRAATLSGRILDESGSGLPDARVFPEVMVSTVSNPNLIASTIFPVANDGSFSRILEPEEYRFFVRVLPEEYSLKSITAGGVDLMKETLKFTGNEPVKVDVRVAKRTTSTDSSAASVKGRAIDALTGAPSVAERVTLCCRESGPVERFSTPVQADGSFEFSAIPRGLYTLGLQTRTGTPALFPVGRNIVVAPEGVSGLEVLSTPQFAELAVGLAIENVGRPSGNFSATVVFTSSNGRVRVEAAARGDFTYFASVPAGDRYTVSVTDLPEGYTVKSGVVSTDVPRTVSPSTGTQPVPAPPPTSIVTITLVRESR